MMSQLGTEQHDFYLNSEKSLKVLHILVAARACEAPHQAAGGVAEEGR
jgi:hypothetical protein